MTVKNSRQPAFSILIAILTLFQSLPVLAGFVHPGVTLSQESILFVRQKIEAGEEPWASAWKNLKESSYASLDWKPEPRPNVERGPSNNPDIGSSEFSNDGRAAYAHALCWTLTGDAAHAKKAAEILDAWSHKLETIGNHDARLLIGMAGYQYCIAAELLKHTWDGWSEKNQKQFRSMLLDVWYPVIKDFYPSANGNWDASMLQAMMAMGVFLDDEVMFLKAKNYFLKGKGNGAIGMYFMESGQCQESGRDQAHTQMGLEFLANTCEIAWIQGHDLYQALDNRLLKGFEYTAKYNLGHDDVPYVPYKSFEGRYHYKRISDDARGRFNPIYEKSFNHYHNRKGLAAPFTEKAVLKVRDDLQGDKRSNRRGGKRKKFLSSIETLMFANQPASFEKSDKLIELLKSSVNTEAKKKVVCFGDSITKRGYDKILAEALGVDTVMAGVAGNSSAEGLRRIKKDVLGHDPDVVVIFFGTNDLRIDTPKKHVTIEDYVANLEIMIMHCEKIGAEAVICTLPPINVKKYFTRHEKELYEKAGGLPKMIEDYRSAAIKVAEKHSISLVDLNKELEKEPKWMSPDGVHPSEEGTRIIARLITEKVKPLVEK